MEEEAGVEEEEAGVEEETGGTSSSTSSHVWLRGPLTLPRRLIPLERRPLMSGAPHHQGNLNLSEYAAR